MYIPYDEDGRVLAQFVGLAALLEVNLAANGVPEVDLAVDEVVPGRGVRIWMHAVLCTV